MLSVLSNWTAFERRLMQFPPLPGIWKQMRVVVNEKNNRPTLPQRRRHRLTGKYPPKVQTVEVKPPSWTRGRKPCKDFLTGKCTNPSCNMRPASPCVTLASLNPDARMATNVDSDMLRLMGRPAKSRRKVLEKVQLPS